MQHINIYIFFFGGGGGKGRSNGSVICGLYKLVSIARTIVVVTSYLLNLNCFVS